MPTSKLAPRPRPSQNPNRVQAVAPSVSSASDDVDVSSSYRRFVDAFQVADREQHASDEECE